MKEKIPNPEFGKRDALAQATVDALTTVCQRHREMGDAGRANDAINQFGEQAIKADLEAEQTVISAMRKYASEKGITIEVRGEETGTTALEYGGGSHFAVLDGLDGSSNYIHPNAWSYGTMYAIANGNNPTYQDFEVAGIALPEENWVLLAIKGAGVYVYDINQKVYVKVKPFNSVEYDETRVLSDNYFPEAKKMLGDTQDKWPRTGSNAASVVAMALGDQIEDPKYPEMNKMWQALADVTRKGNLEQPTAYLIMSELGGVILDKNGEDIGKHSFKEWGQSEKTPIITARSEDIAKTVLSKLTL